MAINSRLKYATVTMVTARINGRTPLNSGQIEEIIEQCEQYVDTIMKIPQSGFTYDPAKHSIIRDAVCNRAAIIIANAEPLSLTTLNQAAIQLNVLRDLYEKDKELLGSQDYINYLKTL